MRSYESSIQHPRPVALRFALTIALLSAMLGCRQQSAADVAVAQSPTQAPVQAKADASAVAASASSAMPAPVASETPKANASALIGRTMPPYPDGLVDTQGVCVAGGEGLEHVCDFGLAVLGRGDVDAGTAQMLYIVGSRNTDTAADRPTWLITDALDMPAANGYALQMGDCLTNGEPDAAVIALSRHRDGVEVTNDIAWVRRYDTASGKFEQIDKAKVSCVDPGFGL